MVRKRLGDLVREEAQQPAARKDAPVTEENISQTNHNEEVAEELLAETTNKISAELESTVDELKKLLKTAQKTETSLQAQITDLKAQLQEQKKLTKELQTQADHEKQLKTDLQAQITDLKAQLQEQKKLTKELQTQADHEKQLKTELEEAKKTILKLAEVSSKSAEKVSAAKKQSNLAPAKSTRSEKLPNYSDPSERPNTTLANKDIGWFD